MVCDVAREACYRDATVPKVKRPYAAQKTGQEGIKKSLMEAFKRYNDLEKELVAAEDADLLY